jgi:hypothetical protein
MKKQGLYAALMGASCALAAYATDAAADPFVANVTRSFAETVVWQIHETSAHIGKMLMEARTRHEDAKAACANDALARSNAAYRRARVDAAEAKEADTRGEALRLKRAVARLNGDRDAAQKASSDVDACFAVDRGDDKTTVHVVVEPTPAP